MNEELKANIGKSSTWMRGFYMLAFAVIYSITKFVLAGVIVFNFGFSLFGGKPNEALTDFGQQLTNYVYNILRFLTFNSEYKPFPFDNWDEQDHESNKPESLPNN